MRTQAPIYTQDTNPELREDLDLDAEQLPTRTLIPPTAVLAALLEQAIAELAQRRPVMP